MAKHAINLNHSLMYVYTVHVRREKKAMNCTLDGSALSAWQTKANRFYCWSASTEIVHRPFRKAWVSHKQKRNSFEAANVLYVCCIQCHRMLVVFPQA